MAKYFHSQEFIFKRLQKVENQIYVKEAQLDKLKKEKSKLEERYINSFPRSVLDRIKKQLKQEIING